MSQKSESEALSLTRGRGRSRMVDCPHCGEEVLWQSVPFGSVRGASSPIINDVEQGPQTDMGHGGLPCLQPGSMPAALYTLTAMSLGIGVFLLPGLVPSVGIVPAILVLIVFALATDFLCERSLEAAEIAGVSTYESLVEAAFGVWGTRLLALGMTLSLMFANAGHLSTAVQMLKDIIEWFFTGEMGKWEREGVAWYKNTFLFVLLLAFVMPFCFRPTLGSLAHISSITVGTVVVTAITMVFEALVRVIRGGSHSVLGTPDAAPAFVGGTAIFQFMSVAAIVYCAQLCLFPVLHELKGRSVPRMRRALRMASAGCCTVYCSVALMGSLAWGKKADANIIYSVPMNDYWVDLLGFLLIICLTLLYPIINYPLVNAVQTVLSTERFLTFGGRDHSREVLSIFFAIAVVVIVSCVPDLDDIFSLCGSLGQGLVCWIMPSVSYLRLATGRPWFAPSKLITVLLLLVGLSLTGFGSTLTIMHIVQQGRGG
eukprot:TRINITY_DN6425_c0_g1_i1.p1 TRINITY_DN6425_c0_g1~~TRINITY_DN6425_c0_g1_i1.p1  ORF type:complete len:501 (-),score=110.79 TRINITY_DN6425_c0_g1_i1:65-1519(-)